MNPKLKLCLNIIGVLASAGLWLPIWLVIEYAKKSGASNIEKNARKELLKKTQAEITDLKITIFDHSAIATSVEQLISGFPASGVIIKVPSVRLYESRQGASVTQTSGTLQAQTKTGTVGIGTKIGPVAVGVAASKGETKGTINSKSITHAGADEMSKIDEGELILSVDSISFAGSQFSRSVDFSDLLSCQFSRNEILVSSKSSEKNWLVALNTDSVANYLNQLVNLLTDSGGAEKIEAEGRKLLTEIQSHNLDELKLFQLELESQKKNLTELESTPSS